MYYRCLLITMLVTSTTFAMEFDSNSMTTDQSIEFEQLIQSILVDEKYEAEENLLPPIGSSPNLPQVKKTVSLTIKQAKRKSECNAIESYIQEKKARKKHAIQMRVDLEKTKKSIQDLKEILEKGSEQEIEVWFDVEFKKMSDFYAKWDHQSQQEQHGFNSLLIKVHDLIKNNKCKTQVLLKVIQNIKENELKNKESDILRLEKQLFNPPTEIPKEVKQINERYVLDYHYKDFWWEFRDRLLKVNYK